MPQTIEHLRILELLGVPDLCVVISKIDVVEPQQIDRVQLAINDLLFSTRYAAAPIFRVSNVTQEGLAALKEHLFHLPDHPIAQKASKNIKPYFRLAIDRVFISKGMGVTITGAIQSGEISIGDQLLLMPQGIPVKVRSIHAQSKSVERAGLGSRCGIVLTGVDLDKVERGDWLVAQELTQEVDRFDAKIEMPVDAKQKIRDGEILLLHHGTDYTSARLILLDQQEVLPGQSALVQLVLQKKLAMCWDDHFILRDMSARYSLAGGRVLDLSPPLRGRKQPDRLAFLKLLTNQDPAQIFQEMIRDSNTPVPFEHWVRSFNYSPQLLRDATKEMHAHELITQQQRYYLSDVLFQKMATVIVEYLKVDEKLVGAEALRSLLRPKIEAKLFKLVLDEFVQLKKIFLIGSRYSISLQSVTFSDAEKVIWDRAVLLLEQSNFQSPSLRDLAKDLRIAEILLKNVFKKAMQQQLLVMVSHDIYYLLSTMKVMGAILQEIFDQHQQITVVEFRNRLNIGRNRVVMIIEAFDKIGFTLRIVRKDPKSGAAQDFRIIKNQEVFL
jgi:selenocysteine-specific elongation factor